MGYFSQLVITLEARSLRRNREPSLDPRERLLDRIRDLTDRLDDFRRSPDRRQFTTYDVLPDRSLQNPILRYVLPEHLLSYDEVHSALMLAENDLWDMDREVVSSVVMMLPGQMCIESVMKR